MKKLISTLFALSFIGAAGVALADVTANTPGAFLAAVTSIDLIFACACGERSTTPWANPGNLMSSV